MTHPQRFYIRSPLIRANAMNAVRAAEIGDEVTVRKPKRPDIQNAKMWAMLADVARAKPEGRSWVPEVYKAAFMHSLGHQIMFADGLDGSGPFPIGFRSSKMSVGQMSDLITTIYQYGDKHGVDWREAKSGGYWEDME